MNKIVKLFVISMLVVLAAAACGSASPEATPEAAETSPPLPTVDISSLEESPPEAPGCEPDPPLPTPNPEDLALYSPDPEEDWIKGAEDASITIVEYGDFQCPYCAVAAQNLQNLLDEYPGEVKLVYRHFPLASIHDKAILAAQISEAAGLQGRFWEMHDVLYENQAAWSELNADDFTIWAADQAETLGLDRSQFLADVEDKDLAAEAEATWIEGQEIGIPGTPYLRINSVFEAQADPALLTRFVEFIKLDEIRYSECPDMVIDPDAEYLVTLQTEKGDVVIRLYPEEAPLAVNSFVFLAQEDWFDNNTFHRVLEGFIAQTGDPTGTGIGSPGYSFDVELSDDLEFDREGLVAMANSGPGTNGSQFFITYGPAPHLDGGYTIFGEVIDGMENVEALTIRDPQSGAVLPSGDLLLDVEVEVQ